MRLFFGLSLSKNVIEDLFDVAKFLETWLTLILTSFGFFLEFSEATLRRCLDVDAIAGAANAIVVDICDKFNAILKLFYIFFNLFSNRTKSKKQ